MIVTLHLTAVNWFYVDSELQ